MAEKHRSAGRNGSRNNQITMGNANKDKLDDILSSKDKQTPKKSAEPLKSVEKILEDADDTNEESNKK